MPITNDAILEEKLKKEYPDAKLILNWEELKAFPKESETHILEIDEYCGWVNCKNPKDYDISADYDYDERIPFIDHYLSTHAFYGKGNFYHSTKVLQKCGFNVILKNWDGAETK
jgi:hypothetical protein